MNKVLVKLTSKGQVTIPSAIRKKIGIDETTFLSVYLDNNQVIFKPVEIDQKSELREYSDQEIREFLENDQVDPQDLSFFQDLLKS